jgi:hypothetical protein
VLSVNIGCEMLKVRGGTAALHIRVHITSAAISSSSWQDTGFAVGRGQTQPRPGGGLSAPRRSPLLGSPPRQLGASRAAAREASVVCPLAPPRAPPPRTTPHCSPIQLPDHSTTSSRHPPPGPHRSPSCPCAPAPPAPRVQIVPGRVSTEVDAHLSHDTRATYDKALRLIDLYSSKGAPGSHGVSRIIMHQRRCRRPAGFALEACQEHGSTRRRPSATGWPCPRRSSRHAGWPAGRLRPPASRHCAHTASCACTSAAPPSRLPNDPQKLSCLRRFS